METVILIVVAVILLVVAVAFGMPAARRHGGDLDDVGRHDADHQFRRPPNEGDLL
jgi:hypothetical protein